VTQRSRVGPCFVRYAHRTAVPLADRRTESGNLRVLRKQLARAGESGRDNRAPDLDRHARSAGLALEETSVRRARSLGKDPEDASTAKDLHTRVEGALRLVAVLPAHRT